MCDPMTWLDPREGTTTDTTHAYLRNLIGAHPIGPVPTHVHYPPAESWADPTPVVTNHDRAIRDTMALALRAAS